jgi:hypothetical protein
MKALFKIIFFLFAMLYAMTGSAQEKLAQNDIDTLFVKALQQRMDWMFSSGYKYVDIDEQSDAPQKIFKSPIKVLSKNDIIDISHKEKKELTVYTMEYKIISTDTVDINFGDYNLKALRKKGKNSPLAEITQFKCGIEGDYEPDIRFVFINNKWKIIKSKFTKI